MRDCQKPSNVIAAGSGPETEEHARDGDTTEHGVDGDFEQPLFLESLRFAVHHG